MTPEQNADQNYTDLKTTREKAGFTLKDMFERTRISVANLEAIENGDFHLLPVPIYTRNFIKTYANVLGMDSRPILQRYENYLQALQIKENAQIKEKSQGETVGSMMARYKVYLWLFCIIIVFAAVSLFVSHHKKPQTEVAEKPEIKKDAALPEIKLPVNVQPENKPVIDIPPQPESTAVDKPVVEEKKSPVQKAPEPKQETKPAAKPEAKPEIKPALKQPVAKIDPKPLNVQAVKPAPPVEKPNSDAQKVRALVDSEESSVIVIRASEDTWLRIKTDDRDPFQVLLKAGDKTSYKGARFSMDIGNAAGVKIQFNGKTFENLGKTGQVIHLRLP